MVQFLLPVSSRDAAEGMIVSVCVNLQMLIMGPFIFPVSVELRVLPSSTATGER